MRVLRSLLGLSADDVAGSEANLASSHCALGEIEAAAAALERARGIRGLAPTRRAFVLTASGHCKEQTAGAYMHMTCHMPHVTCHVLHATCHMSHVTCHMCM